jgi:hypothetical protein
VGEALDHAQSADAQVAAPKEKDLAKGILKAIDVDSYRVEKKAAMICSSSCSERGILDHDGSTGGICKQLKNQVE